MHLGGDRCFCVLFMSNYTKTENCYNVKNMKFIRNLDQIGRNDLACAGGKGAPLGEMIQMNIPVPPGFVVIASTFEELLKEMDLDTEIDSVLRSVDSKEISTIENAAERIESLILGMKIPKNIASEIHDNFKKIDTRYVAVRSSSTAEDSENTAWAGQLESYLNTTDKNLLENIKKCWASLFTSKAIFYRIKNALSKQKISVAVVVQKMVQSEISGVAFSVHPVTEDKNQLIIEACFGLGDAGVSGKITPDSYVVNKDLMKIIDKKVKFQTKGLYRANGGGNKWRIIFKEQGEGQALSDEKILELSKTIIKIENISGFPCDIEWAYSEEELYILQSRPITTLDDKIDNPQEYRKVMNRSMFLMDCEMWDLGERIKLPSICNNLIYFDPLFCQIPDKGTTIYYNFTDIKQDPVLVAEYFNKHEILLENLKAKFDQDCGRVRELVAQKNCKSFVELFEAIVDIWSLISLSETLGKDECGDMYKVKSNLFKKYQAIRKESDGVLYSGGEALLKESKKLLPYSYKEYAEFLLFNEIRTGNLPSKEELEKRRGGFIYHFGQLILGETLESYCQKNNIYIEEYKVGSKNNEVYGEIAFAGKVSGTVRIIFGRKDVSKVKKGDILVASMTTPDLIEAMDRAAAFVTDEGGITCHAAIVAREFKKPCIIGTRVATQTFKDGDKVLVDANAGVIKILDHN